MSKIKSVDDISEDMIGEKMFLKGGGGVMNKFRVVRLKDIEGDRPVLETDSIGGGEFTPVLDSWYLEEFSDQELKELIPIGEYFVSANKIIDASSMGIFSTIHDGDVVLKRSGGSWEKVDN